MRKTAVLLIFFLLFFLFPHKPVSAQLGTYGCFGSGSTGGCQTSLTTNCTNGGVVPNPSQCEGLLPSECNSASFACAPPGTCSTYAESCADVPCCIMLNCINTVCAPAGGGGGGGGGGEPDPPIVDCPGGQGLDTAIGCIPILEENETAGFFLTLGIGIAGGIALILIALASYMITSSAGDPEKLQAGKELLGAALSGLALVVFSAYILRVIGLEALQIPGF